MDANVAAVDAKRTMSLALKAKAVVPSCARVIVKTSVDLAVTRTTSWASGDFLTKTQRKKSEPDKAGNKAPSPVATVKLVAPVVIGEASEDKPKFVNNSAI